MTSILFVILSPIVIACAALFVIRYLRGEHHQKSPVMKKVLRFPGYTLSLEIEKLVDRLDMSLILLIVVPAIFVALAASPDFAAAPAAARAVLWVAYLGSVAVSLVVLIRTTFQLMQKKRGLRGEQIVGQHLEKLARYGYFVYHDFPLPFGNVDHVLVGNGGVFAVETKYRRKNNSPKGHIVKVEGGARLHFPTGKTESPILQARRQAAHLSESLNRIFKDVPVFPVLVFPGWWVEDGILPDIWIGNAKTTSKFIGRAKSVLNAEQVEKIRNYVGERCRDVDV